MHKCTYPPTKLSARKGSKERVTLPSPPSSTLSSSPVPSLVLERSPSFQTYTTPISVTEEPASCASSLHNTDSLLSISEADLYHHYLEHTSRTLTLCESDQNALQFGIPTLALQSRPVLLSVLALSAVCLCCDMISQKSAPDVCAVERALMTGYQHYNQASKRIRDLLSQPDATNADALLASALLLVPFAAATQQVNHWISCHHGQKQSSKLLSSTPRDVIVMMRGLRTTLEAFDNDNETFEQRSVSRDNSAPSPTLSASSDSSPSRRHAMFPILARTSERAFRILRERVESLHQSKSDGQTLLCSDHHVSACASAFELLDKMRIDTFSRLDMCPRPTGSIPDDSLDYDRTQTPSSQIGTWLRSYAQRRANLLLTGPWFLAETPQAYLDLVLPLLDQRLENPVETPYGETAVQLTEEQALALDIYAHWSVLMFLAQEDLWYIGKLPVVTLTGMINRYSDHFVSTIWPDEVHDQGQWWPGSMLRILQELEKCQ